MMLVYGIIGDVSIGKLFIAGVIPGLLLAAVFSVYIMLICLIRPQLAPRSTIRHSWAEKIRAIPDILPVALLIILVLGSLYAGWATPTEAGVVGVMGAFIFAAMTKSLSWQVFRDSLLGSVKTSSMIMLIVLGASYLSVVVGYLGITRELTLLVTSIGLPPLLLIALLSLLYVVLGCLVDGFSMIVMTTPIVLPMVTAAGFDPVWFGIYLVLMIELAQITPPVGFNLFVISSLNRDDVFTIARSAAPFFLLMLLVTTLVTLFPQVVMYLPDMMK